MRYYSTPFSNIFLVLVFLFFFLNSEILDEFNPWYCPRCEKNQCATKTLSVWRFPNYLIVYLKRYNCRMKKALRFEERHAIVQVVPVYFIFYSDYDDREFLHFFAHRYRFPSSTP